ncbi:hypothetical protein ADL00_39055 [Streptomyces sp. AS58]|nr:bifunctional DNA primase/polymerase [Streptomyces sp. AS58]KOV51806.1 hypothetical protein ADL00_39055 [Streptomyces sp. AS58]
MSSSTLTSDGAAWLASAGTYPRSTLALWEERPDAPVVLPCGSAFDIVSAPAIFGRRMLDRLWGEGPGSGPVAAFRGRMLLFAAPGTAQRLPSLLEWEERGSHGRTASIPPLLCHGTGDAVTVPAPARARRARHGPRARRPGGAGRSGTVRRPVRRGRFGGCGGPVRLPLAGRSRHPSPLAAGPGDPALGGGAGGPRSRADIDFSSPRPGC